MHIASTTTLPKGISWSDTYVLHCERCKQERRLLNLPTRAAQRAFAVFLDAHERCQHDAGAAPASKMTVREHMSTQMMAALLNMTEEGEDVGALAARAVMAADALLAALSNREGMHGTPVSVEAFEKASVALAASGLEDTIGAPTPKA